MDIDLTRQQVEKMLQLHLACEQRIGVIIVGPSGSGKSTLWEVRGLMMIVQCLPQDFLTKACCARMQEGEDPEIQNHRGALRQREEHAVGGAHTCEAVDVHTVNYRVLTFTGL